MKLVLPFKSLDIQALFNAAADFHVRLCGSADYLFSGLGTRTQMEERYDRDIEEVYDSKHPFDRDSHLRQMEEALLSGETIILPFAGPNLDEPIPCADGGEYLCGGDAEYSGEHVTAVLMLSHDAGDVTVTTGLEQESITLTGICFSEQSIGFLDKPAEAFVRRFTKHV